MNQNNRNYYQPPYQPYYQPPYQPQYQQPNRSNGVGTAALVCGVVGFLFNPVYVVSIAAVVLGIIGLCMKGKKKGTATAGLILGFSSFIVQFILDLLLSVVTFGLSFFF